MPQLFPSRAFRRTRERASGLLFAFGVDDMSPTLVTGQTLALTRATGRTVFDQTGRVSHIAHSQWPWSMVYNSAEATWEPTLDVRPATTNLCLQSENFGTTWAAISTPTRTAAALTVGDVALDLLSDTSAAALQGYSQVVTFTGNAVKAASFFSAPGTNTSLVVRLRDVTGAANRLLATITWTGGVPTVTMTTGTNIGVIACANGAYRFQFQTTSVTAANTNQLEVYPATTAALAVANTGTAYVGGVQVENQPAPGPYVKRTTATATSNFDIISTPVAIPLADFSVYVRLARPWWAGTTTGWSNTTGVFGQVASVTNSYWSIDIDAANNNLRAVLGTGGSGMTAPASMPATSMIDCCANFRNLTTGPSCRLDVGAGPTAYSAPIAAVAQWNSTTTYIGSDGLLSLGLGVRKIIVASGIRSLSEMRGLNV